MEADAILTEWKEEKNRWVAPNVEPYAISTCTVGVQLTPAISFPKTANWLFQNYNSEETKKGNQLSVSYPGDYLKTILLWNPFLFQDDDEEEGGNATGNPKWHHSPAGHVAHKALPNYCYNSVSFLVNLGEGRKTVNVKYFVNGSMTLTGCSHINDAKDAVAHLQNEFTKHRKDWFENTMDNFEVKQPFVYRMMNAYFSLGYSVDCLKVYNVCSKELGLYVNYDPKEYQGVIIYYMWNRNQENHNGICVCENTCPLTAKRRKGEGEHDCIKLTFIVFSTGKILITGAVSEEQMTDCYKYFVSQFSKHSKQLVQFSFQEFLKKKQGDSGEKKKRASRKKKVETPTNVPREDVPLTKFWVVESVSKK